jgi:hypothetical protein
MYSIAMSFTYQSRTNAAKCVSLENERKRYEKEIYKKIEKMINKLERTIV